MSKGTPTVAAAVLALLAVPMSASAVEISLKIEPGLAIPLSAPQSDLYKTGVGHSVKTLFGLTSFLDVGPSVSFLMLPNRIDEDRTGIAWTIGAGFRLKRPHDRVTFNGMSPWLDADLLYVRTGQLNRVGFDAAIGASMPFGQARMFWIGPFVRYTHIAQGDRPGFDNRDAKLLTLGVSFEIGTGVAQPSSQACGGAETAVTCSDRDLDSIPDSIDRCPDAFGPMDNWGCPIYKKLIVRKDKLELKEKLYFAFDQATLEEASFPLLDEVAQALKDNKSFRVQIEGHTDSVGPDEHNQTLSEQRAATVLNYLAAHGVERSRLASKGFSSSVPTDTNVTAEGRENNRRVEFVVFFNLLE